MSEGPGEDEVYSPGSQRSECVSHQSSDPPWWKERKNSRPWFDKPRRKKTVPMEQTEGFNRAKSAVGRAARSVLGTGVSVAHEALLLAAEPLRLAPVPGLAEAANVLLTVWDALELVQTNRMACVSLVERCADILLAVREEVELAGGKVTATLEDPVHKLTEAFQLVREAMIKQWDKPFLKRYLQRDADLRRISGCNQALTDAVSLFSLSIQIRTLQQLQESEAARRKDMASFRPQLISPPPPYSSLSTPPSSRLALPPQVKPTVVPSVKDVIAAIHKVQEKHFSIDEHLDTEDLVAILRTALHEPEDANLIRLLEIEKPEWPEAIKALQRRLEEIRSDPKKNDAYFVHREFVESGIESLRRMSGDDTTVPSWTITKYEVDTDLLIGMGSFSSVYRGTWKNRTVAIKLLSPTTPRELFLHEIQIWSRLNHPNVLKIYGASSATSEPPWFFVSPYMKNGTLVSYLKRNGQNANPLVLIHEVAVGMEYLHKQEILHGDLKAVNVLVDDRLHCVITDFGQSHLRSEVFRMTGGNEKAGTLRWKAPEVLTGMSGLTPEVDIYAFAITCVEILSGGAVPWADLDDAIVRQIVLQENGRPPIPDNINVSIGLKGLIKSCWDKDVNNRPSFEVIAMNSRQLLGSVSFNQETTPPARVISISEELHHQPSPELRPINSPTPVPPINLTRSISSPPDHLVGGTTPPKRGGSPLKGLGLTGVQPVTEVSEGSGSYQTAATFGTNSSRSAPAGLAYLAASTELDPGLTPRVRPRELAEWGSASVEVVHPLSNRASILSSADSSHESDIVWDRLDSPPPLDEILALRQDERRYRYLLSPSFHQSLRLPLWTPSGVRVGALGYHSKPMGEFITLFNAFEPPMDVAHPEEKIPSLHAYGLISTASVRKDTRSARERAFEGILSMVPFSKRPEGSTTRRVSYPLHVGHRAAFLYAETTIYRYMNNLDTPKKWLKSNIDTILKRYQTQTPTHRLQKEDILLVIGTLEAPDYAMFVSHRSRDGQVHFEVYNDKRNGQKWGTFTTDESLPAGVTGAGPNWSDRDEHPVEELSSCKVSTNGDSAKGWDALVLARLRFRPDEDEPTSR